MQLTVPLLSVLILSQYCIEACYRPFDDEWEVFVYSKRYRGICRTKGNDCAYACKKEGKRGGRCVLTGYFFWSCACMCYRDGVVAEYDYKNKNVTIENSSEKKRKSK